MVGWMSRPRSSTRRPLTAKPDRPVGRTARRTAVGLRRTVTAQRRAGRARGPDRHGGGVPTGTAPGPRPARRRPLLPPLALPLGRRGAGGLRGGRHRSPLGLGPAGFAAAVAALGGGLLALLPDLGRRRPRFGLPGAPRGGLAVGPSAGQQISDGEQPE